MSAIEKLIEDINIPKQLLDKTEALLKTLLGPSFEEISGLIADQIKLRRFNNQVKILSKAQEQLKKNNINPQKVSLKVLAPLIEFCSLEEEENLQNKWANLIAHILGGDREVVFHQNCISILNRISSEEVILLDALHNVLQDKRNTHYQRLLSYYNNALAKHPQTKASAPKLPDEYSLDTFTFFVDRFSKDLKFSNSNFDLNLANLISFGLLKWEVEVDVSASKKSREPADTDIEVDVNVSNSDIFIFTPIGDKFVKICKEL